MKLGPAAFKVAVCLYDLNDSVGLAAHYARMIETRDLACGVNMSIRSVQRAIAELQAAGIVTRDGIEYTFTEKFAPEFPEVLHPRLTTASSSACRAASRLSPKTSLGGP